MGYQELPRSKERIQIPQIEFSKPQMRSLVRQVRDSLVNGDYGTVISDDTSGTIPSLVFAIIANKLNVASGRDPVHLVKIQSSGSSRDNAKVQEEVIGKLDRIDHTRKALVVTEHVFTGTHLNQFITPLVENGVTGDIASVTSSKKGKLYSFPYPLYIGEENTSDSSLYKNYELIGRNRLKFSGEPFIGVETVIFEGHTMKKVTAPGARRMVRPAMHATRVLAEQLYEEEFEPSTHRAGWIISIPKRLIPGKITWTNQSVA